MSRGTGRDVDGGNLFRAAFDGAETDDQESEETKRPVFSGRHVSIRFYVSQPITMIDLIREGVVGSLLGFGNDQPLALVMPVVGETERLGSGAMYGAIGFRLKMLVSHG